MLCSSSLRAEMSNKSGGICFIFFCHWSASVEKKREKYSFSSIITAPIFKCLLFVNSQTSFCSANVNTTWVWSPVPGTRIAAVNQIAFLVGEFLLTAFQLLWRVWRNLCTLRRWETETLKCNPVCSETPPVSPSSPCGSPRPHWKAFGLSLLSPFLSLFLPSLHPLKNIHCFPPGLSTLLALEMKVFYQSSATAPIQVYFYVNY